MNDTCKYADILLPVAVTQEREQVELLGPQMVYYQPKVVENQGETKNDMEILLKLAKRLGFTLGNPTYRTYEEYLERSVKSDRTYIGRVKRTWYDAGKTYYASQNNRGYHEGPYAYRKD